MTTEVNLLGMLQKIKNTHAEGSNPGVTTGVFEKDQGERAKRSTKPPPRLVMVGMPPKKEK